MTGAALVAVIAFVIGVVVAYRLGLRAAGGHAMRHAPSLPSAPPIEPAPPDVEPPAAMPANERAATATGSAPAFNEPQLRAFAEDRRRLFSDVADARAEIARYRQIVVDIEQNAPPPLLDAPGTPDDLKLIVGVGPVIERMLYQLGIATYRQIARWSERDIDELDARLREFPGRIRRDA
ncbi:MAG: hypothetical protein ABI809_09605, partial [Caldimonas sp.]